MTNKSPIWTPQPIVSSGFNDKARIPYGCTTEHIKLAMEEFIDFLGFINKQLISRDLNRLEAFLMSANFSSMVGEFMSASIPKHCLSIVKNNYHNGHPDLVPKDHFKDDSVLHATDGIEIKASRYHRGWQGHNPENVWLMVFVFDCNNAADAGAGNPEKPFRFLGVYGAQLEESDWTFSGRSATSRRTITASINKTGFDKMQANWIYRDPSVKVRVLQDSLQEAVSPQD
jgi:hypothetical protein